MSARYVLHKRDPNKRDCCMKTFSRILPLNRSFRNAVSFHDANLIGILWTATVVCDCIVLVSFLLLSLKHFPL